MFDWEKALERQKALDARAEDPSLWDNPEDAQKLLKERDHLISAITAIRHTAQELDELTQWLHLAEEEQDDALVKETSDKLEALKEKTGHMRLEAMLSGEADANSCFLEIHAGAGGTEAQDWAMMLARMYSRWAEKKGYRVSTLESSPGEEAGFKSVTLNIANHEQARNVYGWLKKESGVHRLVRISPYDGSGRRHTSFASVWVYPEIDQTIHIEIEDKDLRIDTYRASGAGGQHVNKTDSAIRITHLPTGIVVQCQNNRSQHRNRAQAMDMLRARLYEAALRQKEEEAATTASAKTDIGWGHQVRSYVLQPYQMVKDTRTDVEIGNALGVLDGDIDPFLWGMLNKKADT
ncbi:peptide chain release factor 2 [bacterium NHP-B]|nr:peptide chain release factor 2 [bacterium NHP-B]